MAFYSVCDNINKVIQKLIKKCDRKIRLLLSDFGGIPHFVGLTLHIFNMLWSRST